ncbi:MAG: type II asparaginase [Aeromonadales bacterium]|nr:type II asparaginase [Aeromonadales bacterium]MDY2891184.1 type II asparaginase [Succinivibrio sp.]
MIFRKSLVAAALATAIITAPIAAALTSPAAFAEQQQAKGTVYILATGGTIAGAAKSATQTTGYKAGALGVQTLIDAVPRMKDYAKIEGEQIANIGSQDMTTDIWLKLAKRINELLKRDDVTGVVITHGTDTLEETAYFLNLVVKSDKPVVMVGAMRPATAISADGPMNLLDAVRVATDPESKGRGVLVALNDTINAARANTKTNTASLQTFSSPEVGAVGMITGGKVRYYRQVEREHTTKTPFDVSKLDKLPRVDIIYTHVSDDGVMADAAVAAGAKGIVSAGSGMGSIHKDTYPALEKAIAKGVVVVRSNRTGSGFVDAAQQWKDCVTADNLNPQKARILLQLALTQTSDPKKIQEMFDKY